MERISDYERKELWEWFGLFKSHLESIWLSEDCYRWGGRHNDLVKVFGQGGRQLDKMVDVALGPFDL